MLHLDGSLSSRCETLMLFPTLLHVNKNVFLSTSSICCPVCPIPQCRYQRPLVRHLDGSLGSPYCQFCGIRLGVPRPSSALPEPCMHVRIAAQPEHR